MKTITLFTFWFVVTLLTSCVPNTSNNGGANPSTQSIKTKVEDVKIIKKHSNAWAVSGMIRNNSSSHLKGAVKIKFLNSKGDVVHSCRAKVNDGDPLKPGQAGNFKYFTDPEKFDDVDNFDVVFYEN